MAIVINSVIVSGLFCAIITGVLVIFLVLRSIALRGKMYEYRLEISKVS